MIGNNGSCFNQQMTGVCSITKVDDLFAGKTSWSNGEFYKFPYQMSGEIFIKTLHIELFLADFHVFFNDIDTADDFRQKLINNSGHWLFKCEYYYFCNKTKKLILMNPEFDILPKECEPVYDKLNRGFELSEMHKTLTVSKDS